MSIESKLIAALTATSLPVQQDTYTGTASTYITFSYWTIPSDFRDDLPGYDRVMHQVDLFAPITTDLTTLKAQIKAGLVAAGYPRPTERPMTEGAVRHVVFETESWEAV